MAKTLQQLRSLVQIKLNNVGSGENVVFQPDEIDEHINEAILHIGDVGPKALIAKSLHKQSSVSCSGGFATKPDDYYRFDYARLDNRRCIPIDPDEIDNINDNSFTGPGNKNKYLIDYSGSKFQILPSSGQTLDLHYIATLTELSADSDVSPLSAIGDRYAVDWAYALCLESKGFRPDLAPPIFTRVSAILSAGRQYAQFGGGPQGPSAVGSGGTAS